MFTRRSQSVSHNGTRVHRCERKMDKSFFTNVFTNVNTAAFHSSHLGVTCQYFSRCVAALRRS
jgi:hypothetical protein